jgi:quercetin dioxygenase-like cupin family protein
MRVFAAGELPRFESTRDSRSRLDLVTENVPVGAKRLRADRIVYHPGDSAARHYHVGADQLFVVFEGDGVYVLEGERRPVRAGDTAIAPAGQVHSFENESEADFVFVEFWAPLPEDTVWIDTGDI